MAVAVEAEAHRLTAVMKAAVEVDPSAFTSTMPRLQLQYSEIRFTLVPAGLEVRERWAESEAPEVPVGLEVTRRQPTSVLVGMAGEAEREPMGFPAEVEGADLPLALPMPLGLSLQCCRTFSQSGLAELGARAQRALNPPDKLG